MDLSVKPPIGQSQDSDEILHRMVNHIEDFAVKGEKIDFDILKKTLQAAGASSSDATPSTTHYLLKSRPAFTSGVTECDPEKLVRGLMLAFQHTKAYEEAFQKLEVPEVQEMIRQFLNGRSVAEAAGSPEAFGKGLAVGDQSVPEDPSATSLPPIYEDLGNKKRMRVWNKPFENWGLTIRDTTPTPTYMPTTVLGVQNLVRYAVETNRRVRCAGYRHSWTNFFVENNDNDILVSFVTERQATHLPNCISFTPDDFNKPDGSELKRIELLNEVSADGKRLCRIGVAITNEDFRRWAVQNNTYAMPVDVILVEVTVGGVNAPICHGAGLRHQTVSDLVERIDYVDCNGVCRQVSDKEQIKAAAGCFGLMGIVTHVTLRLDEMSYAHMRPVKEDVITAIPPPRVADVPKPLRQSWLNDNPNKVAAKLALAQTEFERRATEDYYSEWFWFTCQQKSWVNTWNTVKDGAGAENYPSFSSIGLQWLEMWIAEVVTHCWMFRMIPDNWKATLLGMASTSVLPNADKDIITPLPDALHFRRCIQNTRVRDMEFEIPLPPSANDPSKPDLSVAQRAWWDVINIVYSYKEGCPLRLSLEMRIMGDSEIIMAPQYGNGKAGTASIEILTVEDFSGPGVHWEEFMQKVANAWMKYGYKAPDGSKRQPKPHWAKEWQTLTLGGRPASQYLRDEAYPVQISEFKRVLGSIGVDHKWTLEDLRKRFSNKLWDEIMWPNSKSS